jgi:hypothetical protein
VPAVQSDMKLRHTGSCTPNKLSKFTQYRSSDHGISSPPVDQALSNTVVHSIIRQTYRNAKNNPLYLLVQIFDRCFSHIDL